MWGGTEVLKRSEMLLRGMASLTLIEKSVQKQGLVSSNLQGEMRGKEFYICKQDPEPCLPSKHWQCLVPVCWLISAIEG